MDGAVTPRIAPTGFREYDLRWRYPEEVDLAGIEAVGRGFARQVEEAGRGPRVVVGRDFRAYSGEVRDALVAGLVAGGCDVLDIGMVLSPMAYWAPRTLGARALAMVTASHNPNGWTGLKLGFDAPLTHDPGQMARLREIVLGAARPAGERAGDGAIRGRRGRYRRVGGMAERYLDHIATGVRLARPLRVLCNAGNGTAGAFAPELLRRIGAEVVEHHCVLDPSFPHYDPNPETGPMSADTGRATVAAGADLGLAFDGDGDRCGVVDAAGRPIFADRLGLLLARRFAVRLPGARFVADVKSTGLFAVDPVLVAAGARVEYWKTGHSHIKRRMRATGAVAGVERSAHYYLAPPLGDGFDCGLRAAIEICRLVAEDGRPLAEIEGELPASFASPTLEPPCPDAEKYGVVERLTERLQRLAAEGGRLGPRRLRAVLTVNGARAELEGGGFALVRASSNTPNLVVICESLTSGEELAAIRADVERLLATEPAVGPWPA